MLTVTGPLVYVRTPAGTVALHEGATVPGDADERDVARLLAAGAIAEAAEPTEKKPSPKGRGAAPAEPTDSTDG